MLTPTSPEIAKKHSLVQTHATAHPEVIIESAPMTKDTLTALRAIDKTWRGDRNGNGNGNGTAVWELQAFKRYLQCHGDFQLTTLVARTNSGLPLGFTINENLGNGYYMGHFGKTLPGHRGLAESLELATARHMQEQGCDWMNFQEDCIFRPKMNSHSG